MVEKHNWMSESQTGPTLIRLWSNALEQLSKAAELIDTPAWDTGGRQDFQEAIAYLDHECLSLGECCDQEREQFFSARVDDIVDVGTRILDSVVVSSEEKEFAKRLLAACSYVAYHAKFNKIYWKYKFTPANRCPYCGRRLTPRQKFVSVSGSRFSEKKGCPYCAGKLLPAVLPFFLWCTPMIIFFIAFKSYYESVKILNFAVCALLVVWLVVGDYYIGPNGKNK